MGSCFLWDPGAGALVFWEEQDYLLSSSVRETKQAWPGGQDTHPDTEELGLQDSEGARKHGRQSRPLSMPHGGFALNWPREGFSDPCLTLPGPWL